MNEAQPGEILDALVSLGADNAIVTCVSSMQRQVKFANSLIVRSSIEELKELHVFASIGKKTGETKFKLDAGKEKLVEFIDLLKKLPDNEEFNGIASGKYVYPKLECFDKKIPNTSEGCVEIVEQALDTCKDTRPGGMFETNIDEVELVSSAGPQAKGKSTSVYFSIRCIADNGSGHKVTADNYLSNLNVVNLSTQARDLALQARNPVQGQSGTYKVVFDALPFAALLDPFAHSTSVFSVESGLSALQGKLGQKIASDCFTLHDDPTLKGAFHATPFDAEGFPTKKTPIVENGVLKTYLHNTSTAKKYGLTSTGHAGLAAPTPWNPVVEKGKNPIEELIREAKNGIYITNLWYTRFQNYATSDFSTIPRDAIMLIENGELTKPLRGIRISDNLLRMLSATGQLSKDQRQIYGWEVETPIFSCDALVKDVKITTPQS